MCGIVAAAANQNIIPVLLEGLNKLEYRGYDSAGLAFLGEHAVERYRAVGRVSELIKLAQHCRAYTGVAHTRWATHGVPSERNAHPHTSGNVAVVHNGIIENYQVLRAELHTQGYVFSSETDTETIAHLIDAMLKITPDLGAAVQAACKKLQGAYAIAVIDQNTPDCVIVAREGSPLLIGLTEHGMYAASDASALLQVTRQFIYLENGDVARLTPASVNIVDHLGQSVTRAVVLSELSADAVDLSGYRHFMQKEIFEQADALANTLEIIGMTQHLPAEILGVNASTILKDITKVLILACGTSYHAGQVARFWLEEIAKIPANVEIASEYRYRVSVPDPQQLIVVISQSGETADTLAALRHAKALGHTKTLALCNVPESAIIRDCALRFITRAGPEIGVASTKAFTTQLAGLFLLTLIIAKQRHTLTDQQEAEYLTALRHLPAAVGQVLALEPAIKAWAELFADKQHAIFLGRGRHYPIAAEGALKLKEISYIHAEAYPAGELKHGPLALIDRAMPVIAVAPNDQLLEKLKANLQEVKARGGELYVFADADSQLDEHEENNVHIIRLPEHYGQLSAIMHSIPLQLLAYHVALIKGTDVDKPRNLAKSVTVE